jgi:protein LTV1
MEKAARAAAPSPEPTPGPEDEDVSGSETEREEDYRMTVSRPKGESAEDRKARKAAVKAERSVSRKSQLLMTSVTSC